MAGSMTDNWENTLLDATTGKSGITATTIYLALFTTDPTETGTAGTEVSGGSYARVAITASMGNAANGSTSNTADITFPTATADWGTVAYAEGYDALTGGTARFHGSFDTSSDVTNGSTFKITAGNLTLTLD